MLVSIERKREEGLPQQRQGTPSCCRPPVKDHEIGWLTSPVQADVFTPFLRQVVQGPPLLFTQRGSTPARTRVRGLKGEELVERKRAQVRRIQGRKRGDKNQFVQESSRGFAGLAAGKALRANEADVEEGETLPSEREGELLSPEEPFLIVLWQHSDKLRCKWWGRGWRVGTLGTRASDAGHRGEPPDWPHEVLISRRFLDRHRESCVRGVRSVHAQSILGERAVRRFQPLPSLQGHRRTRPRRPGRAEKAFLEARDSAQ